MSVRSRLASFLWPQSTSFRAELSGAIAILRFALMPFVAYLDCGEVLAGIAKRAPRHHRQRGQGRRPLGFFWAVATESLGEWPWACNPFLKVKAHMPKSRWASLDWVTRRHCEGNDGADELAKLEARQVDGAPLDWLLNRRGKLLVDVAKAHGRISVRTREGKAKWPDSPTLKTPAPVPMGGVKCMFALVGTRVEGSSVSLSVAVRSGKGVFVLFLEA